MSKQGLAIHTTTGELGLSLIDKDGNIRSGSWDLGRQLANEIQLKLDAFITPLSWSDLDFIAVAKGPGSFTSTRIGVVTAKTIAQQLQISAYGISTLEAIAWFDRHRFLENQYIAISMPAHNEEIFGAIYQFQGVGNLVSGLFGGMPGAGATMGTVVNIQSGGRTAVSGLARAFILLIVVLGLSQYLSGIPSAVLAGIALKVGIDIVDWGFLKRAHKISPKAATIMYGVIALTVFVDLIVAVGVGVFVANILTIERLSNHRADTVKAVTYDDEEIELNSKEKQLLERANGRVLLFYLSGPMIFGVAKAISREHNLINDYQALVLDLSEVPILGVTSSLALENAIEEAAEKGRQVFLVGLQGQAEKRLIKLGVMEKVPAQNILSDRTVALEHAVDYVDQHVADFDRDTLTTHAIG